MIDDEIARKLSLAFENPNQNKLVVGQVINVNLVSMTVDVQPLNQDSPPFTDVPLSEVGNGFVLIPEINSTVLILDIDMNLPLILRYGSISEVRVKNSNHSIKLDASGTTFDLGINGGVPTSLSIQAKLNALETMVNLILVQYTNLLTQLSTIYLPPLAATVASLALPPTPLPLTTKVELENPNLKH